MTSDRKVFHCPPSCWGHQKAEFSSCGFGKIFPLFLNWIFKKFILLKKFKEALFKQCLSLCVLCLVTHSCPALCDLMDCGRPGSSIYGILQARIQEWVAMLSCKGASQSRSPALQVDSLLSEPPGKPLITFSSVQSCPTHCDPMDWSTPGFPVHHQLPEFTQTHVHWVGDAIQPPDPLCPLLLLPSIFPRIRVFSNESVLRIQWPKYWSFNFSISPSSEHPGLISFRMDWLDLLAVQGTHKSLLQHHSSKASILRRSAFFTVQLSHPYMTTGKTIALTRQTFVGKVMSLLFNMLSRLVVTFVPRYKRLLIFMAAVTICSNFGAQKMKSLTVSTVSPSICHEVMGLVPWS